MYKTMSELTKAKLDTRLSEVSDLLMKKDQVSNVGFSLPDTESHSFLVFNVRGLKYAVLCIALLSGCSSRGIGVVVTPADQLLAQEVAQLVEVRFAAMTADDPIIQRYGQFKSMSVISVLKTKAHRVFDLQYPAMLRINCRFQFEKFATPIEVIVAKGSELNIECKLEPSAETMAKYQDEYKLVVKDDGLWFQFGEEGVIGSNASHSFVNCDVSHPDFQP
jgi:hypothetical protein